MLDKRQFFIDGRWVDPRAPSDLFVVNPATDQPVAVISRGSEADVDDAVCAARRALEGFGRTGPEQRLRWLERLLEIYRDQADELAATLVLELGAPATMSREQQVESGIGHLAAFVATLKSFAWHETLENGDSLLREPIGVCGLITPWNWPLNQITLKVGAALAAGCTCVLKPSEYTPLNAMMFARMVEQAGIPAGVFNLVNGVGPEVGAAISRHPDVDLVSFTGSTAAGIQVSKAAADTVKRVTLELGGKSPSIIFADADLPEAVGRTISDCFNNSGQSCDAPTRLLVERAVYEEAVRIAGSIARQVDVGDPDEPGSHIGPLVNRLQFDRVQSLIGAGLVEGAKLVAGGPGRPEGFETGYFVRPTVFADVRPDMRVFREEIFGPVLVMMPFEDENDAVRLANDTVYGLAAYMHTQSGERARRVAARLRAGSVHANGGSYRYGSPFGGYKQSGNGREGGLLGLLEFLETKVLHFPAETEFG